MKVIKENQNILYTEYMFFYLQGNTHTSSQNEARKLSHPLGKRTEAEGTPTTLPQATFTKPTVSKSNTSTSHQHVSPHVHSQPARPTHRHGHGIACSTSHNKPSQVTLPKSRSSISPKPSQSKTTALVKPSPR